MEIYSCYSYSYVDHYSTGSFSDPTDGTALRWRLTSRTDYSLASIPEADWRRLTPKADWRGLTLCIVFRFQHRAGNNGNTGFPSVGYHVTQQYRSGERVHGNIQLRLPSNDRLQSNTSQYYI
jgi:hypothetical protein